MTESNHTGCPEFGVFHLLSESTLRDVGEHISRLGADRFRGYESFAYVFSDEIVADPDDAKSALRYEHSRSIYVVDKHDGNYRLRLVTEDGLSNDVPDDGLQRIKESDLMGMMMSEGSACIMEPGGNYHFVTPSLMHTNRFLRIGDLIRTRDTLDRLSFWIEQSVAHANGLIIDSWSISSLGLRAMQRTGANIPFDCLPEHPAQNSEACRNVVEKLVRAMPQNGKLLVLISISGSGRLLEQIKVITNQFGNTGVETSFLSLYGFKSTPAEIECIARVDDKDGTYPETECKYCSDGSSPIPIDSSSYHLRSWREERVMTNESHFAPGKGFLEQYGEIDGLFFVHRNDPNDHRHHAFYLDTSRLLAVPDFREKLLKKFKGSKDLIVTPTHSAASTLRGIAEEILEIPSVVHDSLDRTMDSDRFKSQLQEARNILILDDAFNSGTKLSRYIQSLREGDYGYFNTVDCLVALARPESELELNQASRAIANRHAWQGALHYVELFLLPRWSEDQCPWCREFDVLSKLEELYSNRPEWLVRRNQLLTSKDRGVSDEPLLLLPNITSPKLGAESVIGPEGLSAIGTLFGTASGLQRHRHDRDQNKQLHPDYPLANVIDPRQFTKRYTEGLIRAAILRSTTRHEFGNQACIESRDFVISQMNADNQKIMAGEILSALGRRSFPTISASTLVKNFEELLPVADLHKIVHVFELPQPSAKS